MSRPQIQDVSVQYETRKGPVMALSGVDLTMNSGDFVVAIGTSGCGKTTLPSRLAAVLEPSAGRILLDGRPVHGTGAYCGVVLRTHALRPWLDVMGNVEFGLRMRGVPMVARRAVAFEKIRTMGAEKPVDHPVDQRSGGMQQRVGIVRALASNPEVLPMDEPLGALDALTRECIREVILQLWAQETKTIFFVTHSVEESLLLATHVIVTTPSPGRIEHRYERDFGRRYIESGDALAAKSQRRFIELREEVVSLTHATH